MPAWHSRRAPSATPALAARAQATTPARPWIWALAGTLLGATATLAWQFPARWAVGWIGDATQQRVLLRDARGSIWNGSAVLGVSGGPDSRDARLLPGRLSWTLAPAWWPDGAALALRLQLAHACCLNQPARLLLRPQWGGGQFLLQGLDLQLPASLLEGLGTPWNTLALDGQISASTARWSGTYAQGRLAQQGQGRLQLQSITSPVTPLRPIGSYQIRFQAGDEQQPGPLRFTLTTLQGALKLEGEGELGGAGWRFKGEAGTDAGHRAALANVLNLIGNRNGPIAFLIRR
ncbi:MAG: type II secretion system protein N [Comamonas sp.]